MANKANNKYKLPTLVMKRPNTVATVSKLNADDKKERINPLNLNTEQVSDSIKSNIKNNDSIMELFPDIELCVRILVSSILSPNDISVTNLNITSPEIKLPVNIKAQIEDLITVHVNENYDIENKQYDILRETLFTKGAYIEAIIPEAAVDDVIHQRGTYTNLSTMTTESLINNYLNSSNGFISKEDYAYNVEIGKQTIDISKEDINISFTDDFRVLLANEVSTELLHRNINKSLFGIKDIDNEEELDRLFSVSREDDPMFMDNSKLKNNPYVMVPDVDSASRKSIGRPMMLKLPPESVLPIHVENHPDKHLGYFVLIDKNGIPINPDLDQYTEERYSMFKSSETNKNMQFNLITKARNALINITEDDVVLDKIEEIYTEVVDNMIRKKLENGYYNEIASLRDTGNIYHVMFMRSLRSQETKLLYLPKELVSYFAFEYRDNGTGRSLLEKSSILFSVRAILLFTRMLAVLKNSVTTTVVTANLDDDELDPERTMSRIISNALNTRKTQLPFGIINVDDMVQWAQSVGFRFNIKGAGLPNMDITTEESSTSKVEPDEQIFEWINKAIYASFGLTPQMIDPAMESDYATSLVANNLLFAKFIKQKQAIYNPLITEHIRKILINDMELENKLRNFIKSNLKDIASSIRLTIKEESNDENGIDESSLIEYILKKYKLQSRIELPAPETTEADKLGEALESYANKLDKVLSVVLDDSTITSEMVGELANSLGTLKNAAKTSLTMKWLADNNYMPEITEFLTNDVDGKPVYNVLEDFIGHVDKLVNVGPKFFKDLTKLKEKADDKFKPFTDLQAEAGESSMGDTGGGSSSDDGGSSDESGGGDDEFDMGDMDMGMDGDSNEGGDNGEESGGGENAGDEFKI